MTIPLLMTKLYVPPPRENLVPRPRLIERLDDGLRLGHKLLLISAPAGFGKTTLLSAWIAACELPVAWLSLDENDNDPARFLAYLIAALQTVLPDVGVDVLSDLQSSQPVAMETIVTTLINDIEALSDAEDVVLILDDYHLVVAQPVHDVLTFLLEHVHPRLHLVIASRADPPLPIARLRGQGQVIELRQSDLRFTPEEAAAFLNACAGLALSPADITALEARTEGWIAGLQMAALALQGRVSTQQPEDVTDFVRAFTGSDRYILDYLGEEVLQRQTERVQDFLLQTSVLDRLTGSLCDAVLQTGDGHFDDAFSDSQAVLEYLERHNLFVVPLDNERRWYRYHRLFADLLRKRLQQTYPDLLHALHRRASVWYEQQGEIVEAIEHALAARDFERAASLVEQTAEAMLMRSQLTTLLGWLDALPEDLMCDRPTLCVFQAWASLLAGRSLDAIEARLQDAARSEATGETASLRAFIALHRGQIPRAAELAGQALEQLPDDNLFMRNFATWVVSLVHMLEHDLSTTAAALDQIAQTSYQAGNVMVAVIVLCNIAELRLEQGRLYQVRDIYQQALEWATDEMGNLLPIAGEALMGLGKVFHQWNDLEKAARYLNEGIDLCGRWSKVAAIDGYIPLAYLKQAQGDVNGAQAAIEEARQLALKTEATDMDDIMVAVEQARLRVLQGNLEAALRCLEERGLTVDLALAELKAVDSADYFRAPRKWRTIEYTMLVEVLLAQGRWDEALTVLQLLLAIAEHWGLNERVIRFQLFRVVAFQAQGDKEQAMSALVEALSLAEQNGYVRIFVDAGRPVAELLYQAVQRGISPEYAGRLLAAFSEPVEPAPQPQPAQDLIEPLSERELEILAAIAQGLSNQEIAQRFYISERTVKWHASNIYGKLQVNNRTEAVAKARLLGILKP